MAETIESLQDRFAELQKWLDDIFAHATVRPRMLCTHASAVEDVLLYLDVVDSMLNGNRNQRYDHFLHEQGYGNQKKKKKRCHSRSDEIITDQDLIDFREFWKSYLDWKQQHRN